MDSENTKSKDDVILDPVDSEKTLEHVKPDSDNISKSEFRLFLWNVGCVSVAWALGYIVMFTHIAATVVIAKELVKNDSLSTIPIGLLGFGQILTSLPLSILGDKFGQRWTFIAGSICGLLGAITAFIALYLSSFALLCIALALQGSFMASIALLRFTVKFLSPPKYVSRSLSIIVGGASIGAILGPNIAKYAEHTIPAVHYGGAYIIMCGLVVFELLVVLCIRFRGKDVNKSLEAAVQKKSEVTASRFTVMKDFLKMSKSQVAIIAGATTFMTMTLYMAPVPLAMLDNGHTFYNQADVIMAHVLGMFTPSFFTGFLIEKLGFKVMIGSGFGFLLSGAAVLISGKSLPFYFIGETLIGVGWNFAYITSSTMITKIVTSPEQLSTIQGVNDTIISLLAGISSLSSAAILRSLGWAGLIILGLALNGVASILILIVLFVDKKSKAKADSGTKYDKVDEN
ncbi:hypothetical protein HK098_001634 [Nowakowskiella sp. JEL0407]|nr:hypothetical protein HK098_001634 [Nowakowskiella sp. JEL0407]